jgi:predicted transcriptional regulator
MKTEQQTDYMLYSWVSRGKQRTAILLSFFKPMTAKQVRKESLQINPKISLSNACDIIRQLLNKKLITCLTPNVLNGKVYKLTEQGEGLRMEFLKSWDFKY